MAQDELRKAREIELDARAASVRADEALDAALKRLGKTQDAFKAAAENLSTAKVKTPILVAKADQARKNLMKAEHAVARAADAAHDAEKAIEAAEKNVRLLETKIVNLQDQIQTLNGGRL